LSTSRKIWACGQLDLVAYDENLAYQREYNGGGGGGGG